MSHPFLCATGLGVLALCVAAGVLFFKTEGKADRFVGKPGEKLRDSVIFGATAPLWVLYAILVNLAGLLPWDGPSKLLTKLK